MSKPNYRATLSYDVDRKVFVARAPELEHCTADGATRAEAIAHLEEEIDAQLANILSHGSTPPKAIDEETFSGELSAKVSRLLHRDLALQARSEGVDIDHLLGEMLAAGLESRKQTRGPRSGNRQTQEVAPHDSIGNRHDGGGPPRRPSGGFGGSRGGYNPAMDDRANFIEYVRGLEHGQAAHAPSRGPGGPGGGGGGDGRRRRGRGGSSSGGGHNQHRHGPSNGAGGRSDRNFAPRENAPRPVAPADTNGSVGNAPSPTSDGGGNPGGGNNT